jgi:hypothetical protein
MGAFFLYHKNCDIPQNKVMDVYQKKGFNKPNYFDIGDYKLILFGKQLIDDSNFICNEYFSLFACGSLFYKGKNYVESLKSLLVDFGENAIDSNRLFGNYVLIFYNKFNNYSHIYLDPSFVKTVYVDKDYQIISTDFLAITAARNRNFSLNKLAIVENITTGNLIPPDTYINEIERVDSVGYLNLKNYFSTICFDICKPSLHDKITTRGDAMNHANDLLDKYFSDAASICDEYGAHIGLTGGFDSRLLLMHARNHINNLITNSFWRPNSREYEIAKELASKANIDFFSFENNSFVMPNPETILDESFFVYDGQIRSQNRWDQIFTLRIYTRDIANGHVVGFHGCGGEQYRNSDRINRSVNINNYILYEWMFKQTTDPFVNNNLKWEVYSYIKEKIERITGIKKSSLDLADIKKIQNEVWNLSNRTTRINVLNQQQFYFAPFVEYMISQYAYYYIPYLGISGDFQIDMMKTYDTCLATVITNYGYNLYEGETVARKIIYRIASLLPRYIVLMLYKKSKAYIDNQFRDDEYIRKMHPIMEDLGDKINYSLLIRNTNMASGVVSFDYLIKEIFEL